MIWDCILFAGEKEVFDIRFNELKSIEVQHIIVQSDRTFTGIGKNICSIYYPNITPIYVYDMPNACTAWERETHQRNAIMLGLKEAKDDDIIIVSDVDEIPSLEAIKSYKPEMGLAALKMDNFWYKFNCLTEKQTWTAPRIMTYEYLKNTTPNEVRNSGYKTTICNAGWHFSYLGNAEYIANKLKSFSHTEYNTPEYTDKEYIEKQIELGISLWGDSQFEFVVIDNTFPKYLYENQDKFKNLIKQL